MIACDAHLLGKKVVDSHLTKAEPRKTRVGAYVAKHQPALAKLLHAALQRQASKIAARMRKFQKADLTDAEQAIVDQVLADLDVDGVAVAVVDDLSDAIIEAFKTAGIYGVSQVGINGEQGAAITEQLDEAALKYAQERSAELIKDFADTTLDDLRSAIANGVAEGESVASLADSIQEIGAFSDARAEMIARTELAYAHVQGNVEGWKQTGEVESKQWILGDLHDVADECDECADAGIVGIDEDFIPGYDFPPAHPNCICDVVPVLKGETE